MTARLLPACYPAATRLLPVCLLHGDCPYITRLLPVYCPAATRLLPTYCLLCCFCRDFQQDSWKTRKICIFVVQTVTKGLTTVRPEHPERWESG